MWHHYSSGSPSMHWGPTEDYNVVNIVDVIPAIVNASFEEQQYNIWLQLPLVSSLVSRPSTFSYLIWPGCWPRPCFSMAGWKCYFWRYHLFQQMVRQRMPSLFDPAIWIRLPSMILLWIVYCILRIYGFPELAMYKVFSNKIWQRTTLKQTNHLFLPAQLRPYE